ncbi:MAG: hypothetical protein NT154_12520 [Verrucomicrobia bacterium]|nr:hypothetical protein [Verrucomicrobiota bacterium]
MKRMILISTGLALALVTGCVVTSVFPFYFEKDVVFEPALLGSWQQAGQTDERWQFAKDKGTGYRVTSLSKDTTNVLQGQLFKLQGEKFLDLSTAPWKEDIQPPPVPSHLLVRITLASPALKMSFLNYEWLGKLVTENPNALRHIFVKSGDKPEDRRLILTADTAELQQFVIKHLKTEGAWNEGSELRTTTPEPPAR